MHDFQEAVTQVVTGTAEAVDHPGAADQRGVGVSVDVKFNRGVHSDTTETTDRLRSIRNRQWTQNALVKILVPVVEEAREARIF